MYAWLLMCRAHVIFADLVILLVLLTPNTIPA